MNRTIQVPLSEEDINTLKAGDYVYLSGIIYTARDAAHKRMYESMHKGEALPIELNGNVLYYLRTKSGKRRTDYRFCRFRLQAVVWISILQKCLIRD